MDCPECGAPLSTYTYMGREASVCEQCGYVGIEVDHTGTPVRVESWDEAVRRFQERPHVDAVRVESRPETPTVPRADTDDDAAETLPPLPERRVVTDDADAADGRDDADADGAPDETTHADDGETLDADGDADAGPNADDDDVDDDGANGDGADDSDGAAARASDEREKSEADAERDAA